jgi:hypothetical protein
MRWGTISALGLLVGGCGVGTAPTYAANDAGSASLEASTTGTADARASPIDAATTGRATDATADAAANATAELDATTDGGLLQCTVVLASDYDQSCATDDDCAMVGQVSACPVTECSLCRLWSINTGVLARYQANIAADMASVPPGQQCVCPREGLPCCRGGRCQQNGGC